MIVSVYYATNRNEIGAQANPGVGPRSHVKGASYLRVGMAEVTSPADPDCEYKVDSIQVEPERIPSENASLRTKVVLGSCKIFDELPLKVKADKSDMILLIHGSVAEFNAALERAAATFRYATRGHSGRLQRREPAPLSRTSRIHITASAGKAWRMFARFSMAFHPIRSPGATASRKSTAIASVPA